MFVCSKFGRLETVKRGMIFPPVDDTQTVDSSNVSPMGFASKSRRTTGVGGEDTKPSTTKILPFIIRIYDRILRLNIEGGSKKNCHWWFCLYFEVFECSSLFCSNEIRAHPEVLLLRNLWSSSIPGNPDVAVATVLL